MATKTLTAAKRAFAWVQENTGFSESVRLLTQMAMAAGKRDPLMYMASVGILAPEAASLVAAVFGVH